MMNKKTTDSLRIIVAFALKDIRDAIQNKMIIRVGLGTLMVWLSSMALPLLLSMRSTYEVRVFDPGRTEIVRELAKDDQLDIRRVRFEDELKDGVGASFGQTLGLIIQPDVDEALTANRSITLQGIYPHWMKSEDVTASVTAVEASLQLLSDQPILVDTENGATFPAFTSVGRPTMVSSALVIVIFTVGGMLTPYLMIEEKEKGTLAALMVSPASHSQFVLGKALAGMFYSLIVAAVALAMSGRWIVHWDVAILATLFGALFTVSLGLGVGVITENPSSMGLWFGLLMMVMLVPVFLDFSTAPSELSWWQVLLQWMPSIGFSDMLRASFVGRLPQEVYLRGILSMLVSAAVCLSFVVWRVRRVET
jgi:ABC-2 type transport system permease protein